MKRILSLVLALALLLGVCAIANAETVDEALAAAAKMTNEELYEKAKAEMAAGAQLNFYSTTSFAEKAAANFMNEWRIRSSCTSIPDSSNPTSDVPKPISLTFSPAWQSAPNTKSIVEASRFADSAALAKKFRANC